MCRPSSGDVSLTGTSVVLKPSAPDVRSRERAELMWMRGARGRAAVKAVGFALAVNLALNAVYQVFGALPNYRYLRWMEQDQRQGAGVVLPDIFLDRIPNVEGVWDGVSDAMPVLCLALCGAYCVLRVHPVVLNRLGLLQGGLMVLNAVVENVTTLPSAYGHERCRAFLQVSDSSEVDFTPSSVGGCAAMIWSGHTLHVMLAVYLTATAVEADAARRFPRMKLLLCTGAGVAEGALVILAHAHWTVDVVLAMIVGLLAFTHDGLERACARANPFLRECLPTEDVARDADSDCTRLLEV